MNFYSYLQYLKHSILKSAPKFFSKKPYHAEDSQLIRTADQFDWSLYDTTLHRKVFPNRLHITFNGFFYFCKYLKSVHRVLLPADFTTTK